MTEDTKTLSERVALAMGYRQGDGPIWAAYWLSHDNRAFHGVPPDFERDERTQPEMLAWLHKHDNVTLHIAPDGIDAEMRYRGSWEDIGTTINAALCNLILAVAEERT